MSFLAPFNVSGRMLSSGRRSHLVGGQLCKFVPIVKGNLGTGCFRQVLSNCINTTVCFLGYRFWCSLCGNKVAVM